MVVKAGVAVSVGVRQIVRIRGGVATLVHRVRRVPQAARLALRVEMGLLARSLAL